MRLQSMSDLAATAGTIPNGKLQNWVAPFQGTHFHFILLWRLRTIFPDFLTATRSLAVWLPGNPGTGGGGELGDD